MPEDALSGALFFFQFKDLFLFTLRGKKCLHLSPTSFLFVTAGLAGLPDIPHAVPTQGTLGTAPEQQVGRLTRGVFPKPTLPCPSLNPKPSSSSWNLS